MHGIPIKMFLKKFIYKFQYLSILGKHIQYTYIFDRHYKLK